MNRKGSHVGMIISFVVFITFIVFMYAAIEPITKIQKEKQTLLDYFQTEVTEYLTRDLTSVTYVVKERSPEKANKCFSIKNPDNSLNSMNIIVLNLSNSVVEFTKTSNGFIFSWDPETKAFKAFYSEEEFLTVSEPDKCTELDTKELTLDADYSISTFRTKQYLFNTTISDLINSYNDDGYEDLKKELNIPEGSGFGLVFTDKDGNELRTDESSLGAINIYASEKAIEYVDSNAQIQPGVLSFRVW